MKQEEQANGNGTSSNRDNDTTTSTTDTNATIKNNDSNPPTPQQQSASTPSAEESFTPPFPKIAVSPELAARRAAAARAYALSSFSSSHTHPRMNTPSSSANTNGYNPPRANTPTKGKSPGAPKTLMANHHSHHHNSQSGRMSHDLKNRLKELEGVGEEDYANFMRSLLEDNADKNQDHDGVFSDIHMDDTEDDEDYQFEPDDFEPLDDYSNDDDDDDDDDDDNSQETADNDNDGNNDATTGNASVKKDFQGSHKEQKLAPIDIDLDESDFFLDPIALEEELGSLLEEDMEAAVNSLLQQDFGEDGIGNEYGMGNGMGNGIGMDHSISHQVLYRSPLKDPAISSSSSGPLDSASGSAAAAGSAVGSKASAIPIVTSSHARFPLPTDRQIMHLQKLMNQHYQVLIQQAVLAVRAAHGNKFKDAPKGTGPGSSSGSGSGANKRKRMENFFCSGENADELAGILDGAVTMLQDLDKNRKDAIRYSIQMRRVRARRTGTGSGSTGASVLGLYPSSAPSAARAILGDSNDEVQHYEQGILTRSVFSRTLRESDWRSEPANTTHGFGVPGGAGAGAPIGQHVQHVVMESSNSTLGASTVFGVRGLPRLNETFDAIDNSISGFSDQDGQMKPAVPVQEADNIFFEQHHGRASEMLLRHARADYDRNFIPGYRDLSHILTYPSEVMGDEAGMPMSQEQQRLLRHSRLQFTAAEDNLLLRGVVSTRGQFFGNTATLCDHFVLIFICPSIIHKTQNLYGEKEWVFISDRFLPDRTVSTIAQRYWRLCLLIYKGNGIDIDHQGKLQERNTPNGIEDLDEKAIKAALKPVQKPGVYGLYRWSMEEDLLLLKSVPLMGRMFAEIGKRFIPYRDRGALRKRYQVLERRVKGAMKRDKKTTVESRKRVNTLTKQKPYTASSQNIAPMYMKHPGATPTAAPQQYPGGYYSRPAVNATNNPVPASYAAVHTPSVGYPPLPAPTPKNGNESYCALRGVIEGELSQLSNFDSVKRMIEIESTKKSQGPSQTVPPAYPQAPHAPAQYLPNMDYNNDSLSGLSVLAGPESNAAPEAKKGGNIMKSVMDRTNDSASFNKAKPTEKYTQQQGYDNESRYQRVLPPSSQINSNVPFSGSHLNMTTPFEHSLMAPPEMEAVEAATVLNRMNMSNASVGFNPPNSYKKANTSKKETSKKTSFFQKVVGDKKK